MHCIRIHIILLTAALCGACGTARKAADRDFYARYSAKWSVALGGNEDRKLIEAIDRWLGVPYKFGGNTASGIDCSGLICQLYREAYSVTLPRNTSGMVKHLAPVSRSGLRFGDVVFFTIKEKRVSHAGLYIADNRFVHAGSSQGVRIGNLEDAYWKKYYAGAGRSADIPAPSAVKNAVRETPAPKRQPPADRQRNAQAKKAADDVIIVFDKDF